MNSFSITGFDTYNHQWGEWKITGDNSHTNFYCDGKLFHRNNNSFEESKNSLLSEIITCPVKAQEYQKEIFLSAPGK